MTQNEMIMRKHIKNAQNTIKYAFENNTAKWTYLT